MKPKEFFTKRGEQAKIKDEAYAKFVETLDKSDIEIPDEVDKLLEKHFMTPERAKADKEIIGTARAQVYNIVDELIDDILPEVEKIDKILAVDISNEKDTLSKIKKLKPTLEKIATKANSANSEDSEKIKVYQEEQKNLLKKINEINTENEKKFSKMTNDFEEQKKTLILDHALKHRISQIEYAEEHKQLRGAIDKVIFSALKEENHLSLNESGDFQVSILENGVPKPKFNGNTQVTFDQVLEEKVKPYVKKNNSGAREQPKETPKHNQPPSNTGGTLQDIRRQQYGGG